MSRNNTRPIEVENYQRIVVPTDGSEGANHAADHGLMLAEALDATAHIISVIESSGSAQRDHLRTSPEELAAEAVAEVKEQARHRNIDVETATLSGRPAQEIVGYVGKHDIDMAVLGTHGRTGLTEAVFGSIAEDVIEKSPVPVLTVKPPEWQED